jgi:hypothetical protein
MDFIYWALMDCLLANKYNLLAERFVYITSLAQGFYNGENLIFVCTYKQPNYLF